MIENPELPPPAVVVAVELVVRDSSGGGTIPVPGNRDDNPEREEGGAG